VVAESATDQSWAVTLVDRLFRVEVVGREQELDLQEACSMGDTVTASAVAAAVVAGACRSWELDPQEACSMGDTVPVSNAAAAAVAYRSWELDLQEACSLEDTVTALAALFADTAVVVVAAAVVGVWELEAYSMGDTVIASAVVVVVAVAADAVVEPNPLEEACSMRDRVTASAAVAVVDIAVWMTPEVVGTT
jgi:hypothetical protein